MIDKQSYQQGFNDGYVQGIKVENQNFIRNLKEYLYGLEDRRKNGDIVIGYWQVRKLINEIVENCELKEEKKIDKEELKKEGD